ncbi:hypothetical protein [Mycobacterium alsense]|uniref:hypothetical protein n=1 Tax=Mycobacterium alsense TaxID=324058 RepID=UPI00355650D0
MVSAGPDDGVPEADAAEQHAEYDPEFEEAGLDVEYVNAAARERDANEADLIDQAFVVPVVDDDLDDA